MPEEEHERTNTLPSCSDGRMTKSAENLRKFMDGQKIIDDRHFLQRNLAPAEPVWKHHLTGIQ